MSLNAYLLLAAAILCCFATVTALPMDADATDHKCRCLTTTSTFINPRSFRKIEILPPGAHCQKIEIIVRKVNGTVCLDPEAKWVNNLINRIIKSKAKVQ